MKVMLNTRYIDQVSYPMACSCEFVHITTNKKEKYYQKTNSSGYAEFTCSNNNDDKCFVIFCLFDNITGEKLVSVPFSIPSLKTPIDGVFTPKQINIHIEKIGNDILINCFFVTRNEVSLLPNLVPEGV